LPTNTNAEVGSRKPGVCSTHWADRMDGLVPRGFHRVGVIWAGRSHIWPVQWDAGLDHAAPRTGPALVVQRSDTPWHPTTWLFRQQTVRCWDDVVRSIAAELTAQQWPKSRYWTGIAASHHSAQ
jgi:hypothetical protein